LRQKKKRQAKRPHSGEEQQGKTRNRDVTLVEEKGGPKRLNLGPLPPISGKQPETKCPTKTEEARARQQERRLLKRKADSRGHQSDHPTKLMSLRPNNSGSAIGPKRSKTIKKNKRRQGKPTNNSQSTMANALHRKNHHARTA